MHPPTCWTRVGALFRPCAPWWCSGQKRAENVETLLPVLCVGRGLVVHVPESCSGRFRVRGWTCRGSCSPYTHCCLRSGWVHPLLSIALFVSKIKHLQNFGVVAPTTCRYGQPGLTGIMLGPAIAQHSDYHRRIDCCVSGFAKLTKPRNKNGVRSKSNREQGTYIRSMYVNVRRKMPTNRNTE